MTAICETCREAYSIRHQRGAKLKNQACPKGHKPLLYATFVGIEDHAAMYQARSKPELKFPIHWTRSQQLQPV